MVDGLTTPHLADACVRLGVDVRCGPVELRPAFDGAAVDGPVVPIRHSGSVDVMLEALDGVAAGSVLVIDDAGRTDRACIGDLVALEALEAGVGGVVVNGCHRDTAELAELRLGVFSLGSHPSGPLDAEPAPSDPFSSAVLGEWTVTADDWIVGDVDGVILIPTSDLERVTSAATEIRDVERRQAAAVRDGRTLRDQFEFGEYLDRRRRDPGYTFRAHLASLQASIEE